MSTHHRRLWPRLAAHAAGSLVLWAAAVGGVFWYLRRMLDEDARALPLTDADSIGLPLFSFALLLAGVLVLANAAAAAVLLWRRRRDDRSRSRPAA